MARQSKNIYNGERLTELAKYIFGNIVEAAYYETDDFDESLLETCASAISDSDVTDRFYIKFINGRIIEFWWSEWGGVGSPDEKIILNG